MNNIVGSFGQRAGALLLGAAGLMAALDTAAQSARSAPPGVTTDSVLIGQSAKISGNSGTTTGRQYRDGLLLAFTAANRAGGVHGRRIDLTTLDDQNDPAKSLANTRTLIEDQRVFALAGYTFTNTVRAALPLLSKSGVPLVGAYTGMPELYDGSQPTVFALRASFSDELAAIIRHVETIGYDQVAMVHYTNPLGVELRDDVAERLKRINRSLVATGAMPINSPDSSAAARPVVQKIEQHCPKLVILGVSGRDAAAIVQGVTASSCTHVRFMARNLVDIGLVQQTLGDNARGVIVTQVVPNPSRGIHPLVVEYRAVLKQRDPLALPDFAEFEGYIVGRSVVLALQRAGRDLDRPGFIKAMESISLEGPDNFRVQFGGGRRAGSHYTNIVMVSGKERITD